MNDTKQYAMGLLSKVMETAYWVGVQNEDYEAEANEPDYSEDIEHAVDQIIAARDAEIREALRSEEAIDHAAAVRDWTGCGFTSPRDTSRWLHMDPGIKEWEREQVRATLQAACDAIGLAEEGAER